LKQWGFWTTIIVHQKTKVIEAHYGHGCTHLMVSIHYVQQRSQELLLFVLVF